MRCSTSPCPNTIDIAEYSSITIALHIESKPKKKSRSYRPVQRPDGVIVEYPRFRSQSPVKPHFEPKPLQIESPLPVKKAEFTRRVRLAEDLRGLGAFAGELNERKGRDGYNAPVDAGRDGYNQPANTHHNRHANMTPMDRFLSESGPWTSYSARV